MKLEAGKKYTDRRGRVYGPLVTDSQFYAEQFGCQLWYNDGRITPGKQFDMDLVAEYVEPVQPEYRMLQDGETVQPDDEYCGHSEKWEKVPSSGNVFQTSLYYPHRRLVEPVKAAEPADNRTAPGEGYRLLSVGESEQKGDQWFDKIKGQWRDACLINAKINNNDLIQGYSIRRKVEQPAPVESPDDLVIQDRVPARAGIDFGWNVELKDFATYAPCERWKWAIGEPYTGRMHGSSGNIGRLAVFCRRKDLPPVPPAEPEFPQYYVSDEWKQTAYIKRTSKADSVRVMLDGCVQDTESPWHMHSASLLASGFFRLVTQAEAEARVKKTRTVVLKEWLCWDDEGPKVLLWQDINPTSDDIEYNNFHHAVETGNTRTVEIPVT